jgi:nitrogen fixation protein FixH
MNRIDHREERQRRGLHWPWILVGLFVVAGLANGLLVIKATSDPSFAVVPDYYERSLVWDRKLDQDRENARMGWSVDPQLDRAGRDVILTVQLHDRGGAALRGAQVEVQALHKARASRVLTAPLVERAAGGYTAWLPLRRPGLWELSFDVKRGEQRFTAVLVRELAPPDEPARSGAGSLHAGSPSAGDET